MAKPIYPANVTKMTSQVGYQANRQNAYFYAVAGYSGLVWLWKVKVRPELVIFDLDIKRSRHYGLRRDVIGDVLTS